MTARSDNSVLVVGVYLLGRDNTMAASITELNRSRDWAVEHRWIAVGEGAIPAALTSVTVASHRQLVPKFVLINQVLSTTTLAGYSHVIVCDDDVVLPPDFVDEYLPLVRDHDFALSQPARKRGSHGSHRFVEQIDGLTARQTRFVEIGPLFCMRRDAVPLLVPFDEVSPMGWGYDFVWPRILADAGLKLGVIDSTPVGHMRPVASLYDMSSAYRQMTDYMDSRPHVSPRKAFSIVESHTPAGAHLTPGALVWHGYVSWALDCVRRGKQVLATKGPVARCLIPFIDALEIWLTDGVREVIRRANGRTLSRVRSEHSRRAVSRERLL